MDHEEAYERGDVSIRMIFENADDQAQLDAWIARTRRTIDLLPMRHISLFELNNEGSCRVTIGANRPAHGGGNAYVGQVMSEGGRPMQYSAVRVSREAMTNPEKAVLNQGQYIYTFLHEFGHFIDFSPKVEGSAASPSLMEGLLDSNALGALAIIRRYHGGDTHFPGEHFADILADYFFCVVGRQELDIHRSEPSFRCPHSTCPRFDRRLAERVESSGQEYPGRREDFDRLTEIRNEALLSTGPFASIREATADSPHAEPEEEAAE